MKVFSTIFLAFLFLNSYAQDENIAIIRTVNKYATDSLNITLINFEIYNNSNNNLVFWIEKDTISHLSNELKIKKYFNNLKGDITLSELVYESEITRLGYPILFFSFYKIIRANDKFFLTIIKKGELNNISEFQNDVEKHFAIVKENESKRLPNLNSLESENYKGNSITIFAECINLEKNE